MVMTEEFLHFIWGYRLLSGNLRTETNELIQILHPGQHNSDAGPDFINAKIRIGDTLWAGNVEIHLRSSDWFVHKHHLDKNYNNIILHVVNHNDRITQRVSGEDIPTMVLKGKYKQSLYQKYIDLMENMNWIPCQNQIEFADEIAVLSMVEATMIERLIRRNENLERLFEKSRNNWEETLYRALARNFGFRINAEPFELLAKSLPFRIIGKHRNDLFQIEALLFGQAGMLFEDFKDPYPQNLKREYMFLRRMYDLTPIEGHLWKFLRMRPPNFPTLRISQFAGLLYGSDRLFAQIMEASGLDEIKPLFTLESSEYWNKHFLFDKSAGHSIKTFGQKSCDLILINTVVPFMFFYSRQRNKPELCEQALSFLRKIPFENNRVIRKWKELNVEIHSAFETQSLLELKEFYCDQAKCLNCKIGMSILNRADN